jgi:hypothetical protein
MGRTWIGFQPATKPVPGHTVIEQASFAATIAPAAIVALITTRAGLEQWLAPVTDFSERRGGNIDFLADDGPFTGSFTRIDVPRAVVLMTDRHGEIAFRLDDRSSTPRVDITVARFVADTEDEAAVLAQLRQVITAFRERCGDGQ